jgi:hypothetical protein
MHDHLQKRLISDPFSPCDLPRFLDIGPVSGWQSGVLLFLFNRATRGEPANFVPAARASFAFF